MRNNSTPGCNTTCARLLFLKTGNLVQIQACPTHRPLSLYARNIQYVLMWAIICFKARVCMCTLLLTNQETLSVLAVNHVCKDVFSAFWSVPMDSRLLGQPRMAL